MMVPRRHMNGATEKHYEQPRNGSRISDQQTWYVTVIVRINWAALKAFLYKTYLYAPTMPLLHPPHVNAVAIVRHIPLDQLEDMW
jgi:hypothetical protein